MKRQTDSQNDDSVYFRSERIFFQADLDGRGAGWYIAMRGGYSYGPFPDRDVAETIAEGLIKRLKDRAEADGHVERQKTA
jgi:hypothetical protein